jgi:hypothetical protein
MEKILIGVGVEWMYMYELGSVKIDLTKVLCAKDYFFIYFWQCVRKIVDEKKINISKKKMKKVNMKILILIPCYGEWILSSEKN